jgi:formylglycine-generating enzyme required for sulfatase activity
VASACVGDIDGAAQPDARDRPADAAPIRADAPLAAPDARATVTPDAPPGECPDDMTPTGGACMDLYEAPNVAGALPLVMYSFTEAEAWCGARDKRLCFDDEWTQACAGASGWPEPYGPTRVPGECNDDQVWRVYNQTLLNGWPTSVSTAQVTSVEALLDAARAKGGAAQAAADHVWSLYQGTGGGAKSSCVGAAGAFDLVGNVEEWTRRRDGGQPQFHGNLKGRYWAEARTCQSGVTTHGDAFRFYEIGFRCCRDATR